LCIAAHWMAKTYSSQIEHRHGIIVF